jgi:hypothetical protein
VIIVPVEQENEGSMLEMKYLYYSSLVFCELAMLAIVGLGYLFASNTAERMAKVYSLQSDRMGLCYRLIYVHAGWFFIILSALMICGLLLALLSRQNSLLAGLVFLASSLGLLSLTLFIGLCATDDIFIPKGPIQLAPRIHLFPYYDHEP